MTPRALGIFFIVTVLSVAAAGWTWWAEARGNVAPSVIGTVMFPALSAPDVELTEITIKSPDYALDLKKKDGEWVAADHGDYPVISANAERLAGDIGALKVREQKTRDPKKYPVIKVEDAGDGAHSVLVHVSGKGGTDLADVLVGKAAQSVGADPQGATFVRRPGEAQAWLAEGPVTIPLTVADWLEPVLHIPGTEMHQVKIEENGKTVFEAAKPKGEIAYKLISVEPQSTNEDLVANDSAVKGFTQSMVSASFQDVRAASDVTFPDNGRTVVFDTTDGMDVQVRLGKAAGAAWITVHADAPSDSPAADKAKQINSKTDGFAFQLVPRKMEALQTDVAKLVQPASAAAAPANAPGGNPFNLPGVPGAAFPGLPGGPSPAPQSAPPAPPRP
jgi:hypothetical protein